MFVFLISLSLSLIDVPNRPLGIKYGTPNAPILIESYVDITCPDCAVEFKTLQQVIQKNEGNVYVVFHFYELASHTWSYVLTRALFAVNMISEDLGKQFLYDILATGGQSDFSWAHLYQVPESEVTTRAVEYAAKITGLSTDEIQLNFDDLNVILQTRADFKYSLLRGLQATPTVFINGVQSDLTETATVDDWQKLIDSLL